MRGRMRMRRRMFVYLVFLLLAAPGPGPYGQQVSPGQQPKPTAKKPASGEKQDPQDPGQIVTETTNVRLAISVVDKSNRFIVALKQTDFQIYEDGVLQRIESFRPESDLPLDVAVLMDTSNSVKPKLKFEKDASISFLYTMLQSRR